MKIKSKKYSEIKFGVLYMAEQTGSEAKLKSLFSTIEKNVPNLQILAESDVRTALFKTALSSGCLTEYQEALYYFDNNIPRRPSEEQTRLGLLSYGEKLGIAKVDVQKIFNKYDALLQRASSEKERQDISYMGAAELHRLFGVKGALVMDGKVIIPAEPGYENVEPETIGNFRRMN